jgi:hypothetical protein
VLFFIGNGNTGYFDQNKSVGSSGKRKINSLQASNAFPGLQFVIYYSWKEGAKKIKLDGAQVFRKGKNWYVRINGYEFTINAKSLMIITAHKIK